jgi:YD repeat-containing protein
VTTTNGYDERQRITSSSIGTTAGALNTTWMYYNNSDVTKTLPDNSFTTALLDSAHRLGAIADTKDDQIDWTLDANGDAVDALIFDPNGNVDFYRTATFDALGRKLKDTSTVTGASVVWTYDKDSNPLTVTDQLNHTTTNVFDALNHLSKSTDNTGGE